ETSFETILAWGCTGSNTVYVTKKENGGIVSIDLLYHTTRQALGFQNPCYLKRAQQLKPKLYDGCVIEKYDAIVVHDSKETLLLAEESRSKMIEKHNDPKMDEKKVITKPIDYAVLNQLSKDFETQVPKELPKVSLVNSSLKKLKFHLASFDMVVKERTTASVITKGTWGFDHTKACFRDDIIPFVKALKELFNSFDQFLIDELNEVQQVFKQIEQAVEQHNVEKNKFQDKMKHVLKENDRLLTQAVSVDIVNIVVHDNVKSNCMNVDALGFQNPCYLKRAQQLKPKLYDGCVIEKYDAIVVHDSKETLLLAEESRSKMIEKHNDPKMDEKKVITKPIDYAVLNQLSKDFETRFVSQTELSAEQAFWSRY
nr:hypothetical protein [Tanacetum cinerariifolium]